MLIMFLILIYIKLGVKHKCFIGIYMYVDISKYFVN